MIHLNSLAEFARSYISSRPISPVYAGTLVRRAAAFEKFAGARTLTSMLTENNLNAFLASLAGTVSTYTLKSYRSDLLTLWRACADDELAAYPVLRKIRRDRLDALVVDCYSESEARALVSAASTMRGGLSNGIPKRTYWPAIIRTAWDCGLRRGDLWRLKRNTIREDGSFLVAQHKTGGIVCCRLRASTLSALDRIESPSPLAWPHNSWTFGEQFRWIVRTAKIHRGTFKFLRRASGSHVEALLPGAGHKHLGHKSPAIFAAHYDAQLGAATLPQPPEL